VGAVLERDYVPGEFWSEHDFRELTDVERVRVWWVDLFRDPTPERGFIRVRQPVGTSANVRQDGEDAVNWMFLDGPPEDDELPGGPLPPLPSAAWTPRSGLPLDTWPSVRWLVSPEFPQEGVDALREALAPVLDDLVATLDFGFTLRLEGPTQLDGWSCLVLPAGATTADDARRLEGGDDWFAAWESVYIRMLDPYIAAVETAANAIQSYVLPRLWTRTGRAEWPVCPIHRTHPLWSRRQRDIAVWECPERTVQVPIGRLASSESPAS
jgi:hypothetical protein